MPEARGKGRFPALQRSLRKNERKEELMESSISAVIKSEFASQFAEAFSRCRVIMFSAPCGSGKSVSAEKLLRGFRTELRSAETSWCLDWENHPLPPKCQVFVLDNMQALTDKARQDELCRRIRENAPLRFLLLSRGAVPGWLMPFRFAGLMETFALPSFLLDRDAVRRLLEANGAEAVPDGADRHSDETRGYGIALSVVCRLMQGGRTYGPSVRDAAKREIFVYMEENVYRSFDEPLRNLLLCVSPFETFTVEMAAMISGTAAPESSSAASCATRRC
jgi:LuxR family maltose regulon positive regulatory protein